MAPKKYVNEKAEAAREKKATSKVSHNTGWQHTGWQTSGILNACTYCKKC